MQFGLGWSVRVGEDIPRQQAPVRICVGVCVMRGVRALMHTDRRALGSHWASTHFVHFWCDSACEHEYLI